MTDASRAETRIMAARTTANLVLCSVVGSQTLEAGDNIKVTMQKITYKRYHQMIAYTTSRKRKYRNKGNVC